MAYTEDMMFQPMGEVVDDEEALGMANDQYHATDVPGGWQDANPYGGGNMSMDMGMGDMGDDYGGGMGNGSEMMEDEGESMMGTGEMDAGQATMMRDAMLSRMQQDAAMDDTYQQKAVDASKRDRKMGKM